MYFVVSIILSIDCLFDSQIQHFMKQRKGARNRNKTRNASKLGRHKISKKWCMITGHDIDFYGKTDEKLAENDSLFTGYPVDTNALYDHGTIKTDKSQNDIPIAAKDIEFIDEDAFVVENWRYRTLKNQQWLLRRSTNVKMLKLLEKENFAMQQKMLKMDKKIKVYLSVDCFSFHHFLFLLIFSLFIF